ncbi:MAG: nucleotidyltransferase [Balneolaceae bacterium]|nr:MAG: nucleotidyltransferase [Balneolaceae bacterium]
MSENEIKQIRLKQRFANFNRAADLLDDALRIESPSKTEQAGIIQFFEITFEFAWKCLKDYLEIQGLDPKYPRDTIKTAVQNKMIDNGEVWLKALTDRNMTVHIYDEEKALAIEQAIRNEYHPLLKQARFFLEQQIQ